MLRKILVSALGVAVLLSIVACGGGQFKTQAEAVAHARALIEAQCPEKLQPSRATYGITPTMSVVKDSKGVWRISVSPGQPNYGYPDRFWIKEDGSLGQFVALGVC